MEKVEQRLREPTVIWIAGVRRVGKTLLCRSLACMECFDCELPRVRPLGRGRPPVFSRWAAGHTIVLDELHRLTNPSEILKLAADQYPATKIIATGSSTLGASSKFKGTLTGRKLELRLAPMTTSSFTTGATNEATRSISS